MLISKIFSEYRIKLILILVAIILAYKFIIEPLSENLDRFASSESGNQLTIAFVSCGDEYFQRSYTMMKSAILFAGPAVQLRFVIVADQSIIHRFQTEV